MKLDFYYWNYMCPLNHEMIQLLKEYRSQLEISFHDITDNRQLAKEMRMFYPTLTVINETHRHYSPLTRSFLDSLCTGIIPQELPYRPVSGEKEYIGSIVAITPENYSTAGCCTGKNCPENCRKKLSSPQYNHMPVLGFMNTDECGLLGGVEYMPSLLVPYHIPRDQTTAFITCIYLSDPKYDYKSPCLRTLEKYLSGKYQKIIVISDETGVFPNGDLHFFLKNGYGDCGIVAWEKDYCTLHLMEKVIS